MHLAYHAPEDHWAFRNRIVRFLTEHHARHHEPRLMRDWNFNVIIPLADAMFGTTVPDDVMARIDARRDTVRNL